MALSVKPALSESPRPLAGTLPYGDRTFLDPLHPARWARAYAGRDCPSGHPLYSRTILGYTHFLVLMF